MQPLVFQPGIDKTNTSYAMEGRYIDGDKIRFRYGYPEVIGGWQQQSITGFLGICRAIYSWRSNSGEIFTAYATSKRLYVEAGGAFFDITPLRKTSTNLSNPLSMTSGSAVLTIDDVGHGALLGDYVILEEFTAGAGLTADQINGEWEITEVVSPDQFEVTLATTATSTQANFGGTAGDVKYLISSGVDTTTFGAGYGAGAYGAGTWGTPRTSSVETLRLRTWSLDNWGEELVGTWYRGNPFKWNPVTDGTSVRATLISGAPAADLLMVTSPDRHMVLASCEDIGDEGSGDFNALLVRWSDQEDYNEWTPAITNTSGSQLLSAGTTIQMLLRSQRQNLIWTDTALTSMAFTGPPFTFSFQQLGNESLITSNRAAVEANDRTYWMADSAFYSYDGRVRTMPCTIEDYVFDDINLDQKHQVFAVKNAVFTEIMWFYPSSGSTAIDRYAVYNYEENLWYHGTFDRTAWQDSGILRDPLAIDSSGVLYAQEFGTTADGAPIDAHLESGDMDIGEGDYMMYVSQIRPDAVLSGSMEFQMKARQYPNGAQTLSPVYTITDSTLFVDTRIRGRLLAFRWDSDSSGAAWRLGKPQINMKPNGKR
jgi:hypothetical protein